MAIIKSAITGVAVAGQSVVGRMVGSHMIADKDTNKIIEPDKIYDYSFIDRHCTLVAKAASRADLDTLESNSRKARGGSATILIPGGNEEEQDLTTDQGNTLWLGFDYNQRINSNLKDGYYLLRSFEQFSPPGTTEQFRFRLGLFWIGASL